MLSSARSGHGAVGLVARIVIVVPGLLAELRQHDLPPELVFDVNKDVFQEPNPGLVVVLFAPLLPERREPGIGNREQAPVGEPDLTRLVFTHDRSRSSASRPSTKATKPRP